MEAAVEAQVLSNILQPTSDMSPFVIRWGFNPVVRDKILNARECGISVVPFGRWFPIPIFGTNRENHTTDELKAREDRVQVNAEEAQGIISDSLAGTGAQTVFDWGTRFAFYGEEGIAKMETLSQALLPTLSSIRALCAEYGLECPIAEVCEATDDTDFGPRESCVSCWSKWISSPACSAYLEIVAKEGMTWNVRDPHTGEVKPEVGKPSIMEFNKARDLIIDGMQVGINSMRTQWADVARDEERGVTLALTNQQHIIRKDLHANKPQDRQLALVETFAKAQNTATGGNNELMTMLVNSQMQTNAAIQAMAAAITKPEPNFGEKMAAAKAAKQAKETENETRNNETT